MALGTWKEKSLLALYLFPSCAYSIAAAVHRIWTNFNLHLTVYFATYHGAWDLEKISIRTRS